MQHNQTKSKLKSLLETSSSYPFERSKIIGHNTNPAGIVVNQLLLVCRMTLMTYASFKLGGSVLAIAVNFPTYFDGNSDFLAHLKQASFLINAAVNAIIILDCANVNFFVKLWSDYKAGMAFRRFVRFWGVSVHVYRLALLTVSAYHERYSLEPFTHLANMGSDQKAALLIDHCFLLGAAAYLAAILIQFFGRFVGDKELTANPWTEDWEWEGEYLSARKRTVLAPESALIIANSAYIMFFWMFFLQTVMGKSHFTYDWKDLYNVFLPAITVAVAICNIVYSIFRKLENKIICASFVFNSLLTGYFFLQLYIELKDGEFPPEFAAKALKKFDIVLWTYVTILAVNFLVFVLLHSFTFLNLILWFIKWFISINGIASILMAVSVLLIMLGGVYSSHSLFQQYFYLKLVLDPSFKKFIEAMKVLFDVLMGIINVVMGIIDVLNKMTFGCVCIILMVIVLVTVPVLSAIGWGVPIPVMVASKLLSILLTIFQMVNSVRRYMPLFQSIAKFTSKHEAMGSAAGGSSATKIEQGGAIFIIFNAIGGLLVFFAAMSSYFFAAERYTALPRPIITIFIAAVAVLGGFYLAFVLCLEYLFSRTYELEIMMVTIRLGWGTVWAKVGLVFIIAGLVCSLAAYVFGDTAGINKTDSLKKRHNLERFVCPHITQICCPLFEDFNNEGANKCSQLLSRFLGLCSADETNPSLDHVRQIFCPVFSGRDPRNDEPTLGNLLSNACCCFCTFGFGRKVQKKRCCHPLKALDCYCNMLRVQREKTAMDDAMPVTLIEDDFFDFDYQKNINHSLSLQRHIAVSSAAPHGQKPPGSHSNGQTPKPHPQRSAGAEAALHRRRAETGSALLADLRRVCKNGFTRLLAYLLPLLFSAAVLYFAFKALFLPWASLQFSPNALLTVVVKDTSTEANSGHSTQIEKGDKNACPLLDLLNAIKDLILTSLVGALTSFFPQNREMIDRIARILMMLSEMSTKDLLPPALRLLVLAPALCFVALQAAGSACSAFFAPCTRMIVLLASCPCFALYVSLLLVPQLVKDLLESVPFFDIKVVFGAGYWWAKTAYWAMFLAMVLMAVDHFMPPWTPRESEGAREQYVRVYDAELSNVVTGWVGY